LDLLKSRGIVVPTLSDATQLRISELLPPMTYQKNPVDTGRPGPRFAEVVSAVLEDAAVDAVISYALSEPAALDPGASLPAIQRPVSKPILFGTMGPPEEVLATQQALRARDFYVAQSPEELARAAYALARDARLQAHVARDSSAGSSLAADNADVSATVHLPQEPNEHTAKQLLAAIGIATPRRKVCASHEAARAALRGLQTPVVAKILSAEIAHKTEVGGVCLNIQDAAGLADALAQLDTIPLGSPRRYLIEEMAPPGFELIVSATRDDSFGPTVMVGLGGIFAEALRDTAVRLAPLSLSMAEEMLLQLRAAPLLTGFRGGAKLDLRAAARTIVQLGELLCAHPEVQELELNPLRVYPSGVLALDALLAIRPADSP
jgi:acetate---CoA ligase (ADP-forming)